MAILTWIILFVIAYILFALPLFIGLLLMGKPHGIIKVGIVNFLAILINIAVLFVLGGFMRGLGLIGMILPFIITMLFYREMFKIKFFRAFFVLILQYIFGVIIYIGAAAFGLGLLLF